MRIGVLAAIAVSTLGFSLWVGHNGAFAQPSDDGDKPAKANDSILNGYQVVYSVSDLVYLDSPGMIRVRTAADIENELKKLSRSADFEPLIELIQTRITPEQWKERGGDARMACFEANLSLVIYHDKEGHREIEQYLEMLKSHVQMARALGINPRLEPLPTQR